MNDFNQQNMNDFDEQNDFDPKQDVRPLYEQVWFIVVVFILFWPAGIILAAWRFIRDQQIAAAEQMNAPLSKPDETEEGASAEEAKQRVNKARTNSSRSCKGLKICGWTLIGLGIIWIIGGPNTTRAPQVMIDYATGIGLILAGVIMLLAARRIVAKWDRYESYINKRGNTSIRVLARKMGLSEKTVRVDVQNMINKGFFDKPKQGISAYIDGEYDLIVMTKYGEVMQPLRKVEEEEKEVPANSYIAKIRKEIARTEDEELLEILRSIEASVAKIEEKIEEEPNLKDMTNIKKLKDSYLPQTLELMRKFNDGEGSDETRWEIKAMLGTCATAFKNIEAKVYEREDIDTRVEMEVLRKTLEREGLLGSDFDIKE